MKKFLCSILSAVFIMSVVPVVYTNASTEEKIVPMTANSAETVLKPDGTVVFFENIYKSYNLTDNVKWFMHSGGETYAFIKNDNSLWMSGLNTYGQIGNGKQYGYVSPTKILEDVRSFDGSYAYSAAVKNDNSLWMWGGSDKGSRTPKYIMDNVKQVSVSPEAFAAVKTDDTLWMWGYNWYEQMLGFSKESTPLIESPVQVMSDVASVKMSDALTVVLKNDGTLWYWGLHKPQPIKLIDNVASYDVCSSYVGTILYWNISVIRKDSSLWCVSEDYPTIQKVMDNVACSVLNDYALTRNGNFYVLRKNEGVYSAEMVTSNVRSVSYAPDIDARTQSVGLIKEDGSVWRRIGHSVRASAEIIEKSMIKVMQLCALSINGENMVIKDKETVLTATYYDENGVAYSDNDITWGCDSDCVSIIPNGNQLTVKGLKSGNAKITAVHNSSAEMDEFEIAVGTYELSLDNYYNIVVGSPEKLKYSVFLDGTEVKETVTWTVRNSDGSTDTRLRFKDASGVISLEGLKEGECSLLASVKGVEIANITLKIWGSIKDMVGDETILRAKVLANSTSHNYYVNDFKNTPSFIIDNMSVTTAKIYNKLDNIFKDPSAYYEVVLLDILNETTDSEEMYGGLITGKMSEQLLVCAEKALENDALVDAGAKIFTPVIKDLSDLTDCKFLKLSDVIDMALTSQKIAKESMEGIANITALGVVANSKISALESIKEHTNNKYLKKACENVIKRYSDAINNNTSEIEKYAASKALPELINYSVEMVASEVLAHFGLGAVSAGVDVGKLVNSLLLNTDDISAQVMTLYAYTEICDAFCEAVNDSESRFNNNKTYENAQEFIALSDMFKSALINGCDVSSKFVDIVKDADRKIAVYVWGDFTHDSSLKPFGKNVDYAGSKKTIANTKKIITNTDFYSLNGTDIVAYISEVHSTSCSTWAEPEIKEAIEEGILPEYMCFNYTDEITRAEFCTLLTNMLCEKTDMDIEELIEAKGVQVKSPFADTYYEYVDYIYKLGIVNGMGDDMFRPLEKITREQAATMLMRAAEVLGFDTLCNADVEDGVSDWAASGVAYVTENGIMNGTGNGFEPKETYTKEQAIATLMRMYKKINI